MSESLIFGTVKRFAIEISQPAKKARIRVWAKGTPFGEFKRSGELLHSVQDLRLFLRHLDSLTERALARKTPEQIYTWLLETPSQAQFSKRRKYIRFLGDQMDHLTMFTRLHEGQLEWTFCDHRGNKKPTSLLDTPPMPRITTMLLDKETVA